MDIFAIIGVGVITSICVVIVKQVKPDIAIVVGVAGGIVIVLMLASGISTIIQSFSGIAEKTGLAGGIFTAVLKIVGVGYLTEFAANLCADSGNTSIANKILLAGKIVILVVALPIVSNLIDIIMEILP